MANTYTQLYVQYVFTVKGRENLIKENLRPELEKVMCGIVSKNKSKTLAVYCNPDHTHIFVGLHPTIPVSKLIEQIKSGSSNWLNSNKYIHGKFCWQDGYGAFSYSKSHIEKVVEYIINQPERHKTKSFQDEYLSFLKKFNIDYDSKYLFEWYDN